VKRSANIVERVRAGAIWVVLAPIRAYSRWISPLFPRRCKYYPTCSAYAQEAIRTHGVFRGGAMAAWRVMRCNPFSHGGVDEVPPPREGRFHSRHA
jgi:uncharacterized protein